MEQDQPQVVGVDLVGQEVWELLEVQVVAVEEVLLILVVVEQEVEEDLGLVEVGEEALLVTGEEEVEERELGEVVVQEQQEQQELQELQV